MFLDQRGQSHNGKERQEMMYYSKKNHKWSATKLSLKAERLYQMFCLQQFIKKYYVKRLCKVSCLPDKSQ